ncbi:MAG: hypothetical protein KYX68_03375 [Flavobacterium sp.]|nr:hypothetical protein [Flavobacterium sp.]
MKKILLFFLLSNILFCQERLFIENQHFQTGIDSQNENYLVFDNSNFYYFKKFNSNTWNKQNILFNEIPTSTDFPYNFFHIKDKNYFVHKGCGTVYEFRNDSIIRIDNSFEHKSQFNASTFIYHDEIYYFGGYGLFTFKNILTKYDFKTREWELVKYSDYNNIPKPRSHALTYLIDDDLYVIGGFTENYETNLTTTTNKALNDIWKLNLTTKKWTFLGNLKNKNFHIIEKLGYLASKNNLFFDNGKLYQIDFKNEILKSTEPKGKYTFSLLEQYNSKTNEIFYVLSNSDESNRKYEIIVENFDDYKSDFVNEDDLFESNNSTQNILLTLAFLSISLVAFYFLKKKRKPQYENKIILKDSNFYYKDKVISNLSNEENELLHFFFKHKHQALPMNEVVDFFSKNDATPYNTLTKKKDLVLNGLKQKLAFILEVEEEDLFITQKNTEDKRIKEIQLNPRHF